VGQLVPKRAFSEPELDRIRTLLLGLKPPVTRADTPSAPLRWVALIVLFGIVYYVTVQK
jgi:hypothetical protein